MIKIKPIIRGLAAATVAAFFTGCAHYSPSNPGSSHWKNGYKDGVFYTIDSTSPSRGLIEACPDGAYKLDDKFVTEDGHWYVYQRYRCLKPSAGDSR